MTPSDASLRTEALKLSAKQLRRKTKLPKSYARARDVNPFLGQDRAKETVELAADMTAGGFNLFVATPPGTRARQAMRDFLDQHSKMRATPADWVYVNNFEKSHAPIAIKLPPGKARFFQEVVQDMVIDLHAAIPAAFDKPDVQARKQALESAFNEDQEDAFEALGKEAKVKNVTILRTPMGFTIAPIKDGKIIPPDELQSLPETEQDKLHAAVQAMQAKLTAVLDKVPAHERELREKLRAFGRETVETAIAQSMEPARKLLCDIPVACDHLDAIRKDIIQNVPIFANGSDRLDAHNDAATSRGSAAQRYAVNVFVDHSDNGSGAPVVEELDPTLAHLVGRVEHRSIDGALTTNFMLIKPGALHTANGGYLILDARQLLTQPMSWAALKRALQSGCIKTESLAEALNLTSTITLEPSPIPLDIKIVLIGDAWIYHLLAARDLEFTEHFKLLADFDHDAERTQDSERDYATFLNALAKGKGLRSLTPRALERLIEEAARENGDANRMSLASDHMLDIMTEANHRAETVSHNTIEEQDILKTLTARETRLSRIRDRMQANLMRGISLVETSGEAIGQINGLSVFQFGEHRFGKPSRISARVRPGQGRVIDIEREARLGGPIHSKGVMILTGYLAGHYIPDRPMSLLASVVLEQSYGGVEGDSASLAELIAILSALSNSPIKQSLAITGSINQHGQIQAIGGANEKVEGFYDLCAERGLKPGQGVIIPASNVQHLMLRQDIVDACQAGTFSVFAVEHLDDALSLLTGQNPKDLHHAVDNKLRQFADVFQSSKAPVTMLPEEKTNKVSPARLPDDPPSDPPRTPPHPKHNLDQLL